MKLFRIAVCGALLAAMSVAIGQTKPGDMVVDVPFAFVAGRQTLPAGRYIVAAMDDTVRIFNSQTAGLYVASHSALRANSEGSKLVFHRFGDTYFLSGVWATGNKTGRELFPGRAERELTDRKVEMELAVVHPEKLHSAK
jgi:hypothetical protein